MIEPIVVKEVTIAGPRTVIMGVLNVTPDSFSDGGRFAASADAVRAGLALAAAGAEIIDVGGESTRPGAPAVSVREELARVLPVIEGLRAAGTRALLSIDSLKAEVADAALAAGADLVNDVSGGLMDPALLAVCARRGALVVLGHLRGTPATMMKAIAFSDVVAEVTTELAARVEAAVAAGVPRGRVLIDPGLGFGKELEHNLALVRASGRIAAAVGRPIVVGPSRKAFLGRLTGIERPAERDFATAAAVTAAVLAGAHVVRVHDAAALRATVQVGDALRQVAA